jgi:hypothetical protein
MKRFLGLNLLFWIFIWYYCKSGLKRLAKRLFNWQTAIIFIIVFIIMSSEVWVPYIIYFVTDSEWWLGIGSTCWAFWAMPFTPFIELCIAITLGVDSLWRRIYAKIRGRQREI